MKCVPISELIESGKYVVKRNPWRTMWEEGKVAYLRKEPSECIISKVPPWAKSRGGLEARPAGIRAVNAIMEYIWGKLDDIHPGYRTAITEKAVAKLMENVEGGGTPTADDLDRFVEEAMKEVADELGITVEELKTSGTRTKEIKERRKKTREGLVATAKRLVSARTLKKTKVIA